MPPICVPRLAVLRPFIALALLATAVTPIAAASATTALAPPTGVHVTAVSPTGFSVAMNTAAGADHYRMFASTTRSAVYVANIAQAKASALSTTPVLSIGGLPYTTTPYSFRIETLQGTARLWSAIYSVGLKPAMPTSVKVSSSIMGTTLTWASGAGTGFQIAQGTNYVQTLNRHIYTTHGSTRQFSPYFLAKGVTYYFRVRALNAATGSSWSPRITVQPAAKQENVRLMTYNMLEATADGTPESGTTVAPWAQRQLGVVKLIKAANPGVIAVQEAAAWTGAVRGPRMIDGVVSALGGAYSLARTEIPPSEPWYFRTGNYILYKTAVYRTYGTGGHWTLPYTRFASYQILQNKLTGARVLVVDPHLSVGAGATNDSIRRTQTQYLLRYANAYAATVHVPIIYGGDFNSDVNPNHAFDGPGLAMEAVGAGDALHTAQVFSNAKYNSANLYMRTPPAVGQSIDHIYAPAGVAITSWRLILQLSGGSFVGVIPSDHNPLVSDMVIPF